MSSLARKQPVPACGLVRWGIGPLDLGTPAAVFGSLLEGVSASPHRLKKHYAALAGLAGLATETQTADGLPDAWAMCTCTRRSLDTSAMASTTASPATPLGRRATSSHAAWPRWSRTSIRTTSQAVLAADWRHWRRLCTGAVREWWSCRAGGCAPERKARSAGKARADR